MWLGIDSSLRIYGFFFLSLLLCLFAIGREATEVVKQIRKTDLEEFKYIRNPPHLIQTCIEIAYLMLHCDHPRNEDTTDTSSTSNNSTTNHTSNGDSNNSNSNSEPQRDHQWAKMQQQLKWPELKSWVATTKNDFVTRAISFDASTSLDVQTVNWVKSFYSLVDLSPPSPSSGDHSEQQQQQHKPGITLEAVRRASVACGSMFQWILAQVIIYLFIIIYLSNYPDVFFKNIQSIYLSIHFYLLIIVTLCRVP